MASGVIINRVGLVISMKLAVNDKFEAIAKFKTGLLVKIELPASVQLVKTNPVAGIAESVKFFNATCDELVAEAAKQKSESNR